MASPQDFSIQYGPLAADVGKRLGVDPSILLGQWGLETGWGKSVIPGTNNLGNIKDLSGQGTMAIDNATGSRDAYRTYSDPSAFGNDFATLIENRYKGAIGAGNDATKFATALKSGGYAEDPNYVSKLVATTDLARKSGGLLDRVAQAVLPSAQAAETPLGPPPVAWKDVVSKPEFQALAPQQQAAARDQYFQQVVAPRVPADQLEAARAQFNKQYGEPEQGTMDAIKAGVQGVGAGLGQGVGTVTLNAQKYLGKGINAVSDFVSPPERNLTSLITGQQPQGGNSVGNWLVNDADQGLKNLNAEVAPYQEASPIATKTGEFAGNFAATLPVGGVLARGVGAAAPALGRLAPYAQRLAESLRTGGVSLGGQAGTGALGTLGNIATRAAGGGGTGYVTGALIDPNSAETSGLVGAAFPLAARTVASGAGALARAIRGNGVAPEVAALAQRAEQLGINIPADRLVNSRPLNAAAASLNYVPLSGRAAVEDAMQDQLNRALTRTFGQNSTNVTQALRQAEGQLGGEFDRVLRSNVVNVDNQFLNDLATNSQRALSELPEQQAGVITRQIDEIINQGAQGGGQLDGQLAYNIKRTLDRIGQRNSPEAWYATQLRRDLMEALNRSLGPNEAAAFAQTRQQYGSMLSLRQLAQNGAEGDVSIARLANMKNINNPQMQELADIAAQFLKTRESAHGAAQRVNLAALAGAASRGTGLVAGLATAPVATGGGIALGRALNAYLNSNAARNMVLGGNQGAIAASLARALPLTARALPVLTSQ